MGFVALQARLPKNIEAFINRADYKAKTGQDAPPMDWTQRPKFWTDKTATVDSDEEIEYVGIRYLSNGVPAIVDGNVDVRPFRIFGFVAAIVNLPPEPLPSHLEMTEAQRQILKRPMPQPLALLPGEKVVRSATTAGVEIDDGIPFDPERGDGVVGWFTNADRAALMECLSLVRQIAAGVNVISVKINAMVDAIARGFQNPAAK